MPVDRRDSQPGAHRAPILVRCGDPDLVGLRTLTDGIMKDMLLAGFEAGGIGICLCDEEDRIRYVNAIFERAIGISAHAGFIDFAQAAAAAIKEGRGIKLDSMNPDSFEIKIRTRRKTHVGSTSFAADTSDGKWWWVTDTKLPNGWLLAILHEISALKQQEAVLRDAHATAIEEAQTDVLTGVPNRRHGLRCAERLLAESQSNGTRLTLALLDIDHFKRINDEFGHDIGDMALVHFAGQVSKALGPNAQFSRIGGEEFLAVASEEDHFCLASTIEPIVDRMPPLPIEGSETSLVLTTSVGLAVASSKDTMRSLMHRADVALFEAKAAGRACLRYAPEVLP